MWQRDLLIQEGDSQEKTANVFEAIETYSTGLPFLSSLSDLQSGSVEFRKWTDRLLSRLCFVAGQAARYGTEQQRITAVTAFRVWARFADGLPAQRTAESSYYVPEDKSTRRILWRAYYDTLSDILQQGLSYYSFVSIQAEARAGSEKAQLNFLGVRIQQRAELKKVQTIYETLLLQVTRFPKADQRNEEIESWVDAAMANWRTLCGPGWNDEELGEAGKGGVAREVLDVSLRQDFRTSQSHLTMDSDSLSSCFYDLSLHPDLASLIHCPYVSS